MEAHFDVGWDHRVYIFLQFLPIIIICSIRNLKYISPFSILATSMELLGRVHHWSKRSERSGTAYSCLTIDYWRSLQCCTLSGGRIDDNILLLNILGSSPSRPVSSLVFQSQQDSLRLRDCLLCFQRDPRCLTSRESNEKSSGKIRIKTDWI